MCWTTYLLFWQRIHEKLINCSVLNSIDLNTISHLTSPTWILLSNKIRHFQDFPEDIVQFTFVNLAAVHTHLTLL